MAEWWHACSPRRAAEVRDRGSFPADYRPNAGLYGSGVYLTSLAPSQKTFGTHVIPITVPSGKYFTAGPWTLGPNGMEAKIKAAGLYDEWHEEHLKRARRFDDNPGGAALQDVLLRHGYDGVQIQRGVPFAGSPGEQWLLVFDPLKARYDASRDMRLAAALQVMNRPVQIAEFDVSRATTTRCVAAYVDAGSAILPLGFLTWDRGRKSIELVFVGPQMRRKGLASRLLAVAESIDGPLYMTSERSPEGTSWSRSTGRDLPKNTRPLKQRDADGMGARMMGFLHGLSVEDVVGQQHEASKTADFDEAEHPRGGYSENRGEFSPASGPSSAPVRHPNTPPAWDDVHQGPGRPDGTGTLRDPIDVGNNLDRAVLLIAQGKHIRLDQPDEVSTLCHRIYDLAQKAKARGKKMPIFDLCYVSVPGTNIFCHDTLGIPRTQMPQLGGVPIPGSPAAKQYGEGKFVNLAQDFINALQAKGISVTQTTKEADRLRATQGELNGAKVSDMAEKARAGTPEVTMGIFVTRDGYILDGHHTWAAQIVNDGRDNHFGDVPVRVSMIDTDIGTALDFANAYSAHMGIPQRGVDDSKVAALLRIIARNRTSELWGTKSLDALFPDKAPQAPLPFERAGRLKTEPAFDRSLVDAAVRDPNKQLVHFDPRQLHHTLQAMVTRQGVEYYLGGEYERSGKTFADQDQIGNHFPVIWVRPNGQQVILSGHHRAVAALLKGEPLVGIRVDAAHVRNHAHLVPWRSAEPQQGLHRAHGRRSRAGHQPRRSGRAASRQVGHGDRDADPSRGGRDHEDASGGVRQRRVATLTFEVDPTPSGTERDYTLIRAMKNGQMAGWVELSDLGHGTVGVEWLEVQEDFQRQGVASALMDWVYAHHSKVLHSSRTEDGTAWWEGYRKGRPHVGSKTASTYTVEVEWAPYRTEGFGVDLSQATKRYVTVEADNDNQATLEAAQMVASTGEGWGEDATNPINTRGKGMVTRTTIMRMEAKVASAQSDYWDRALKHKTFWHITSDPHFTPSATFRPMKQDPFGVSQANDPRLYVTSDLAYWHDTIGWGLDRGYAAEIDMSNTTPEDRWHNTSFEYMQRPEVLVKDPSKVRVKRVIPLAQAYKESTGYDMSTEAKVAMPMNLPDGITYKVTDNGDWKAIDAHLGPADIIGTIMWNTADDMFGMGRGEIEHVEVHEKYRRRGLASELLRRAREIDPNVHHSTNLTSDGRDWSRKVAESDVVMYHGTRREHVDSIDREGLRENPELPDGVWLVDQQERAASYGDGTVYEVRVPRSELRQERTKGHWSVSGPVPPDRIRRIAAEWLPTKGMFSPGKPTLDPRIFNIETNQLKQDGVVDQVIDALDEFWTPQYGDWRAWAHPYLTGSAASHWWDTDKDFDVLIGIDKAALDMARPQNREISEEDVCAHLSRELKESLDPTTSAMTLAGTGPWEVTYFCNPGSYPITDIKPYAAIDLMTNTWVVEPPKLVPTWGPENFPHELWMECEQVAREAETVLNIPDPADRHQACVSLFDWLHAGRQQAYSPHGTGWLDYSNAVWQYLGQHPDRLLQRLYAEKHRYDDTTVQAMLRGEADRRVPSRVGSRRSVASSVVLPSMSIREDDGAEGSTHRNSAMQSMQGRQTGDGVHWGSVSRLLSPVRQEVSGQEQDARGNSSALSQARSWHNGGTVRGDVGVAGRTLRDVSAHSSTEEATARRSLPCDGEDQGVALSSVQHDGWALRGRSSAGAGTGQVDGAVLGGLDAVAVSGDVWNLDGLKIEEINRDGKNQLKVSDQHGYLVGYYDDINQLTDVIMRRTAANDDVEFVMLPSSLAGGPIAVAHRDGAVVGFLENFHHKVDSLWVDKAHRRKGIASQLFELARQHDPELAHSEYRTRSGDRWAQAQPGHRPPLIQSQQQYVEQEAARKATYIERALAEHRKVHEGVRVYRGERPYEHGQDRIYGDMTGRFFTPRKEYALKYLGDEGHLYHLDLDPERYYAYTHADESVLPKALADQKVHSDECPRCHTAGPVRDRITPAMRRMIPDRLLREPRPVVLDRGAEEDLAKLPGGVRNALVEAVHKLEDGQAEVEAKVGRLAGAFSVRLSNAWRALLYVGQDLFWHLFSVTDHDYAEVQRRFGAASGQLPPGYEMEVHEQTKWGSTPYVTVLVKHEGEPVAGLGVYKHRHPHPKNPGQAWYVDKIEVYPKHQRKGIATAMYDELHRRFPGEPVMHSLGPAQSDEARRLNQTLKDKYGPSMHLGAADNGIPPKPGTAPIPPGHVRLWHYTHPDHVDSIREHGLDATKARGDSGQGYGNEASAGIWASTKQPSLDQLGGKPFVEFHAPLDDISKNADDPWRELSGLDPPGSFQQGYHHVIMKGSVPKEQIVAIHEPWHTHYHYINDDPQTKADAKAGVHDSLLDDPDYGPAIERIKREASGSTTYWHVTDKPLTALDPDHRPAGGPEMPGFTHEPGFFVTDNPELWRYLWRPIGDIKAVEVEVPGGVAKQVGAADRDQWVIDPADYDKVTIKRTVPINTAVTEAGRQGKGFALLAPDAVPGAMRGKLHVVDHRRGWGSAETLCGGAANTGDPATKWTTVDWARHNQQYVCPDCLKKVNRRYRKQASKTVRVYRGEGPHSRPSPYVTMGKPELAGAFYSTDPKIAIEYGQLDDEGHLYELDVPAEMVQPGATSIVVRDSALRMQRQHSSLCWCKTASIPMQRTALEIKVDDHSPLPYDNRYRPNERISLIDGSEHHPDADVDKAKARQQEKYQDWRSRNKGRRTPDRYKPENANSWVSPGFGYFTKDNTDPGTVAFVDLEVSSSVVEIAYMAVRPDQRRKGLARQLIEEVYRRHPGKQVNWGKMMQAEIGHLYEDMQKSHPDQTGSASVYY